MCDVLALTYSGEELTPPPCVTLLPEARALSLPSVSTLILLSACLSPVLCPRQLGATLANSQRSEGALPAYHKALDIKPKYARAWLNMGTSAVFI